MLYLLSHVCILHLHYEITDILGGSLPLRHLLFDSAIPFCKMLASLLSIYVKLSVAYIIVSIIISDLCSFIHICFALIDVTVFSPMNLCNILPTITFFVKYIYIYWEENLLNTVKNELNSWN